MDPEPGPAFTRAALIVTPFVSFFIPRVVNQHGSVNTCSGIKSGLQNLDTNISLTYANADTGSQLTLFAFSNILVKKNALI